MDKQTKVDLLYLAERLRALEDGCIKLNHEISEWTEFVSISFLTHFTLSEHINLLDRGTRKSFMEVLTNYRNALDVLDAEFHGLATNYSQTLKRIAQIEEHTDKKSKRYLYNE